MPGHTRTAIRRLAISGYRSIAVLELDALPDLVVLHGPNGAGKSNLLGAAQLALRAAALGEKLPLSQEQAISLSLPEADKQLGLRPDDFHWGAPPVIRVEVEIELGTRAAELARSGNIEPLGRLALVLVVDSVSPDELRYWFERAEVGFGNGKLWLEKLDLLGPVLSLGSLLLPAAPVGPALVTGAIRMARKAAQETQQRLVQRIRKVVLPALLQVSPAYRVPGGVDDPETALFQAFLSEDRQQREATRRLSRRLARAGLFGSRTESIGLTPIKSTTYNEQQVRLVHPTHGDLALRNLGSGEQQVVFMLAQRVITPAPISLLEEPEAHLHTSLMEPFADVLLDSVSGESGPPDVDQLWIATHHHQFALALEYLDVSIEGGATIVKRLPRAMAVRHFFEPGPVWEALRQLASSAKEREAVVFRDAAGEPVTAGAILDSIEKDPEQRLAQEYARTMTENVLLSMRRRAEKPQ